MSFLNPLYFIGAMAALVPVLLHLVRRERAEKLEFPTLMFLRRVSKKSIRYQKLRHLILLLLRIAMVLLLVLAFTRPFRPAASASVAIGRTPEAHVILVDNSMSMAYGDRWERARDAAAAIVRQAQPGDRIGLIEFSNRALVRSQLGGDFPLISSLLADGLRLSDRTTRFGPALRAAEQMLIEAPTPRRFVHLISDFQRTGWTADEQDYRLGPGIELQAVDVSSPAYSNLAPSQAQILERSVDGASEYTARFVIANFGTRDREGIGVSLAVDEQIIARQVLSIEKGKTAAVEFPLAALLPGSHSLHLAVADDHLTRDDSFALKLVVRGKIPVLAVQDPGAGRGGRSPSFFLSYALNVSGLSPYQLSTGTLRAVESESVRLPQLVVWNGVSGGGPRVQELLRQHTERGNGLVLVIPDDRGAADFNRTFGGWLPVKIGSPPGERADHGRAPAVENYALLTDLRMDHPIFRPFRDPHSGNFSSAKFYRHARLQPEEGAQVLARFDDGHPALVSVEGRAGKVVIMTFGSDDISNDLPLKAVYAPFWQQVLGYVQKYHQERRWLEVGETFAPREELEEASWQAGGARYDNSQVVAVVDPSGARVTVEQGSDRLIAERIGFYEIRAEGWNSRVAVNAVPQESDLASGDAEEMIASWTSGETAKEQHEAASMELTPEQNERRQGYWRTLLILVVGFFIAEGWLGNRSVLKPE